MEKIHSHNRKLSFHLARVRIISLMEYKNTKNDYFHDNASKKYKVKEILCRKIQRNNGYINKKSTLGQKYTIINERYCC